MKNNLKCVVVDDEPMAREILISYINKTPNLNLIETFKNASDALVFMQDNIADVYFLDINMPEISGLTLAKIINKKSKIIFTTAYREYAVDGFKLEAVDYLLKPIAYDRFLEAIKKVDPTDKVEIISTFMFVRSERKMVKVDFEDIFYVESLSDYVKIITTDKTIITRETITNLEEKLNKNFIRIHRSFIVPINKINSYTNETIEINKKALPISRSYKESVLQKLAKV
jgi:DNA-binding LytR/AlgR family response regulator